MSEHKQYKQVAALSDLQYPTSCCCERCSFFLKWPDCLGGAAAGTVCCIEGSSSFQIKLETPKICCKFEQTQCCIDVRAALPNDEDVPFAIGICGFMLYDPSGSATKKEGA